MMIKSKKAIFFHFLFLVLFCFFIVDSVDAGVYKAQWKKFPKSQKINYVHGLCNGEHFALRCVYLLETTKTNNKLNQLLPIGHSVEEIVRMLDSFYKGENTDTISISWALYIISQEKQEMSPDKLVELENVARQDYSNFVEE